MQKIFPPKLQPNDLIRVVAPARSLAIFGSETRKIAQKKLNQLGLQVSFGEHVEEEDEFGSSSIESRVADLHAAFADKNVKGILTVIGGFNSNQLLDSLDWELIKNNPKVFCGYSDITLLNNVFYAKTGLVNYSGPHFTTFGQRLSFEYTIEYFKKCVMNDQPFEVLPSDDWTDDAWYIGQEKRLPLINEGYWVINEGSAQGTILGSNLCTLNLIQGTQYMPSLENSILFLEDDYESQPHHFDRDLQSLIHLPDFSGVKGIVIGKFQKDSHMTLKLLQEIIRTKKALAHLPVLANVNFGHTEPRITLPIGGTASMKILGENVSLKILEH